MVSNEHGSVSRVDPTTNLVTDTVDVGPKPRFTTVGGGSIWTLNQGDGTVSRVDVKTRKLTTNIPLASPERVAKLPTAKVTSGRRFSKSRNANRSSDQQVIKQWLGAGGDSIRVGHGSVWISNLRQQNLWRIDARQP